MTDVFVHVDRTIRSAYPEFVKKAMNPELETEGPSDYDPKSLHAWSYDAQGKPFTGHTVYEYLKANDMLRRCLSMADGIAIQEKRVKAFRRSFDGMVYLWRAIAMDDHGFLNIPALYVSQLYDNPPRSGRAYVKLTWEWLGLPWQNRNRAYLFPD